MPIQLLMVLVMFADPAVFLVSVILMGVMVFAITRSPWTILVSAVLTGGADALLLGTFNPINDFGFYIGPALVACAVQSAVLFFIFRAIARKFDARRKAKQSA